MKRDEKIFVAGHRGLVGSAIVGRLNESGYTHIIKKTHDELDLIDQGETERFFKEYRPDCVFLAAAKVGGILANSTYKANFIYENLMIASNVINAAYKFGVKKLLNLGSSCIYPKFCPQPMKEKYLLSGTLEDTNEPYAVAKIAAIKLCRYYYEQYGTNFISIMPTNLYGCNDNFDPETSHVIPALIRKLHEAKIKNADSALIWGTGNPRREFLYVDDLADACVYLMERFNYQDIGEFVNIGTGKDLKIKELANLISTVVGYEGKIRYDDAMPDGTPQKLLDVTKINSLGWKYETELQEGLKKTYNWYLKNYPS